VRPTDRAARRCYSPALLIISEVERRQAKLLQVESAADRRRAGWVRRPRSTWRRRAWAGFGIVDVRRGGRVEPAAQILHSTERGGGCPNGVGEEDPCRRLNRDVAVTSIASACSATTRLELFSKYDLIVDGSDNFGTRYLGEGRLRAGWRSATGPSRRPLESRRDRFRAPCGLPQQHAGRRSPG